MTRMPESVAVIITTYNAPAYLARVLDGYLLQTKYPDELIVADDGSGPETRAVVESFAQQAPFAVRHVWHEDSGFRAARIRNEAVRGSTAAYLIFTDGDCIPQPSFVADHCRLARPGWFVQGKRMLVDENASGGFTGGTFRNVAGHCLRGQLSGWHHLLRLPGVALRVRGLKGIKTCNLALWRSDFYAVNGFDESFVGWGREDAEFAARLFHYGLSRRDPPFSALVFHLWHPENSRSNLPENDRKLQESVAGQSYYCRSGVVKDVES